MNFFRKPQVKTLSEWLEIATSKLAACAKERIKSEMESHFVESVQAHLEEGLSDSDSQTAALQELGDAQVSARRFRKHHLTQSEASSIASSNKTGRSRKSLLLCYALFVLFILPVLVDKGKGYRFPFLFVALEFAALIALPTVCYCILNKSGKKAPTRSIVLMMSMSGCTEGMMVNGLMSSDLNWLNVSLSLTLLLQVLIAIRLWRKLGFPGAIQNEFPPVDTPTTE